MKYSIHRVTTLVSAFAVILSLTACNNNQQQPSGNNEPSENDVLV